jgi:hypothetical protein
MLNSMGAVRPTLCDLFLPDAVLVVNETVPFDAVTKADKLITQLLQPV